MSRSGYSDDLDNWQLIRWRGVVASATRGRRGQALLRDLRDALDAMPAKRLIARELACADGVCALGALAQRRGLDVSSLDPEDINTVAGRFDIATPLAQEIVNENDEFWSSDLVTPERRWQHMRAWVEARIIPDAPADKAAKAGA